MGGSTCGECVTTGELRQDGSAVQALIRTEALAADNAFEPAYLGEFLTLCVGRFCIDQGFFLFLTRLYMI